MSLQCLSHVLWFCSGEGIQLPLQNSVHGRASVFIPSTHPSVAMKPYKGQPWGGSSRGGQGTTANTVTAASATPAGQGQPGGEGSSKQGSGGATACTAMHTASTSSESAREDPPAGPQEPVSPQGQQPDVQLSAERAEVWC